MSYYPKFARLLAELLQEQERTPAWLARRLSISPSTVNRWLNNGARPGDSAVIVQIADLLCASTQLQTLLVAAGYGYVAEAENNDANTMPAVSTAPVTAPSALTDENNSAGQPSTEVQQSVKEVPPFLAPGLPPQGMVGRDGLLKEILGMVILARESSAADGAIALQGMGGIGKTTLAIALARMEAVRQLFPDGVLWTSVGPTPVMRNLLEQWGRALGVSLVGERDEAACRDRLRTLLHQRRMLLIVDDLWEAEHAGYFAVAGPQCIALYTTRETPIAHSVATRERTVRLDLLSLDASLQLLTRLVPEAVTADKANAQRLCERLEFLPLALTLAGRLLANEADIPSRMSRLVTELIERRERRLHLFQQEGRLGSVDADPLSLHAILGLSVERLSATDQQRFAMLAVFGGEPLMWDLDAARFMWDCTLDEAETTLSMLIQRGLVTHRQDVYWMHALLADYAAEMLAAYG